MYLQRLVEFSEAHPELFPVPGYKRKKYQWIVDVIDDELDFVSAVRGDIRILPDITRSSGVLPILLADKAEYVFGFAGADANEKSKTRAKERQHAYLALLEKCAKETDDQSITQIYSILQKPSLNLPDTLKPNDVIVFRVNDDEFPHEREVIQSFWRKYLQPTIKNEDARQCMVCGELGPVMERHSITFPLGPERTKLISANATAYESQGLKASAVSPVCYKCEQKYGQALEFLLQRHTNNKQLGGPHMFRVGDLTYVYWLRKKEQVVGLNSLINLTSSNPEEVKELLQSVFSGIEQDNELNNFCVLTLSANKARVVVRGYEENTLKSVQENIERFFVAQNVNQSNFYGVYALAATMYTKPSTQMEKYAIGEWMKWFMDGKPLSTRVLVPLLKQIQSGGVMYPQHGAAIKSWVVSQNKEGQTMTVNKQKAKSDADICGRLFAVLEKLQQEATGAKETIASRFFGSASTAPRSVFGLLIKNSQAHLNAVRKKSEGAAVNYSKRIQDILENLDSFPGVLDLEAQAEFSLGYYHERQNLYTKKADKKGAK